MERLFILAVPNNSATYNAEKAEKADIQAKKDQILRYEKSKELQQVKGESNLILSLITTQLLILFFQKIKNWIKVSVNA